MWQQQAGIYLDAATSEQQMEPAEFSPDCAIWGAAVRGTAPAPHSVYGKAASAAAAGIQDSNQRGATVCG
jgi:hypothetical protein